LSESGFSGKVLLMSEESNPKLSRPDLSREERLAAKLRENLRRRKVQSKSMASLEQTAGDGQTSANTSKTKTPDAMGSNGVPKTGRDS
jgi:hypothetical protein